MRRARVSVIICSEGERQYYQLVNLVGRYTQDSKSARVGWSSCAITYKFPFWA